MKPQISATELYDINQPQLEALKANGFFIYGLRDWEGNDYGIEPNLVWVNNIGVMVTDKEIPEVNEDGYMAASEFYKKYDVHDVHYDALKELLEPYENTNYHFHIKGKMTERYECIRTYSYEKAKEILKARMESIKKNDPTARYYRFGYGNATGNRSERFWKKYFEIEKARKELKEKEGR